MQKPSLCIVTPALSDANNGNWQTARRWARWLAGHYRVRLAKQWPDGPMVDDGTDILLALHARRSAASVAAWAQAHPARPLVLALTGTDLYRDIATDASAQQSLALAHRLVVLQEQGPQALPEALRNKCRVVFQSSTARQTLPKTHAHLRTVMVGHLREEKSPQTLLEAARLIQPGEGIYLDHVGQALDPALGDAARQTQRDCPHYRWLGGQPHAATRSRIQRAHVLVHPSRMEGGAHVIMEAVLCGTPVLASRIAGNVGMLGADYGGYFPPGDAAALAALLRECRTGQTPPGGGRLATLQAQCAARAPLFDPAAEQTGLLFLLDELLNETAATARPERAAHPTRKT
ncbi:MAG: selenoneine biosynthesis selenosugar synthase SenB [Hydrogenophaga sp.]|uniref:selenoneine biosynthesis selenosugar synthase SenB n=1 Tax=Hydrogenophaga sp. TaxID=1904254 RepID=UPI002730E994|nr:selenoneine biosynthesis selenosugar synthase SenB [Hydrogenophaga sp.]MDP2164649.1 selenoneine biosynthesis selenosugar synthase SenB [Hydrogenophaga sp.]MDP3476709.1 selenoneine biosynthesis selenosugar synthase SenB [Hydrogenophaga sp.]